MSESLIFSLCILKFCFICNARVTGAFMQVENE